MNELYFVTYLYGKLRIFKNCCSYLPLNIVWRQQKKVCQYSKKERKTTGVNRVNIISCKCEVWMTKWWKRREISGRCQKIKQNGMQLKLYPFSYIQITLPYCLYIKRYKVKCLVFEKITLFWATLCGYNLYSRLKAVTLRQTQQII